MYIATRGFHAAVNFRSPKLFPQFCSSLTAVSVQSCPPAAMHSSTGSRLGRSSNSHNNNHREHQNRDTHRQHILQRKPGPLLQRHRPLFLNIAVYIVLTWNFDPVRLAPETDWVEKMTTRITMRLDNPHRKTIALVIDEAFKEWQETLIRDAQRAVNT